MRSVLRCTICRYLKNVMEQIPHYNNRRCFLPSCLKTVYTWMTLDLPENKPCASPYSECSRQWQSNPLCTTASSNTWWRNLPTWFWRSMLHSEFISAEVYLCLVFINTLPLELHLEQETTFLRKDIIKKIPQTFWNEEEEACGGNIWILFSCYSLISSTNRFRSQLPLLGPTRTLFKTH